MGLTEALGRDDAVRAIVYRGAGTEAFASGADISEFPESRKDPETARRYNATTAAAYAAVRECAKPTVALCRPAWLADPTRAIPKIRITKFANGYAIFMWRSTRSWRVSAPSRSRSVMYSTRSS